MTTSKSYSRLGTTQPAAPGPIKAHAVVGECGNVRAILLDAENPAVLGVPVTVYEVAMRDLDQAKIGLPLFVNGEPKLYVKPGIPLGAVT